MITEIEGYFDVTDFVLEHSLYRVGMKGWATGTINVGRHQYPISRWTIQLRRSIHGREVVDRALARIWYPRTESVPLRQAGVKH